MPKPHSDDGRLEKIIRRFCKEERLDPQQALVGLVRAMVERHVDYKLRTSGSLPTPPGGVRPEALVPAMDALHQRRHDDTPFSKDCELLFRMLSLCSLLAEERIDEQSKPMMRLVE